MPAIGAVNVDKEPVHMMAVENYFEFVSQVLDSAAAS